MNRHDAAVIVRELEAMTAVSRALSTLNPVARQRVMRWAIQRFQLDQTRPAALPADGLPPSEQEEAIEALFRELAADFQRLALKAYGA
jgi:hypothetical protein